MVCTIGWLLLLASVIDGVFVGGRNLAGVTPTLLVMVLLLMLLRACSWAAEVLAERASSRVREGVRSGLVDHLFAVGPAGMSGERVGEVSATIGDGVEALHDYVTKHVLGRRARPGRAAAGLRHHRCARPVDDTDPAVHRPDAGAAVGGDRRTDPRLGRHRLDELGWLSAFYLDMIRGLATLKAFGRSRQGAEMIERASKQLGDATMEVLRTAFQTSLVMEWAATAATALVAVEVSFRMIVADLPFGAALAVLLLTPEFFVLFRRLAIEYHAGHAGVAALKRIEQLRALPIAAPSSTGIGSVRTTPVVMPPSPAPALEVEFRNVEYRYPGASSCAVTGFDLRLEPGRSVALVGASGAGKTTVARLLLASSSPPTVRSLWTAAPSPRSMSVTGAATSPGCHRTRR